MLSEVELVKRSEIGGEREDELQEDEEEEEEEEDEVAMCVCVHANSVEGYLHLSRLAWSVTPPMVRPPFSSLPDYTVIDERVWGQGLGGVLLAGYWGPTWEYVPSDAYIL